MNDEHKKLLEFWKRVCVIIWDCGDLDGGTFQDLGVELGLLREEVFDPEGRHKGFNIQDAIPGDPVFIDVLALKE